MKYHVRRKELKIKDPANLKKILESSKYVTLAMCNDDRPYLVSLSHGYDAENNCVYFHCANEGKKIDYLKSNSNVWGQAVLDYGYKQGQCNHHYATAQFYGKVAFVNNIEERNHAIRCMVYQLDDDPEPLVEELMKDESLENTLFGRVDIEFMTGKKSEEVSL